MIGKTVFRKMCTSCSLNEKMLQYKIIRLVGSPRFLFYHVRTKELKLGLNSLDI